MKPEIVDKLRQLNHQFYQTFAHPFSATRQRLQPGVQRILEVIPPTATILDLGCGNGELARRLAARGHQSMYVGLDFSQELLHEARDKLPEGSAWALLHADLLSINWDVGLPLQQYDLVLAFATLHHLPGQQIREQLVSKVRALLAPNGNFIHSNWQFLNSERLQARIVPWHMVDLKPGDVDPGDYLLDWRRNGHGLRYVHHFSEEELHELAAKARMQVHGDFTSDGEGGNLSLYQIWQPQG